MSHIVSSGGYGREIYHSMMHFGNDPFVRGTRPTQIISMETSRERFWKLAGDSSG
jgi:hypothetical protein